MQQFILNEGFTYEVNKDGTYEMTLHNVPAENIQFGEAPYTVTVENAEDCTTLGAKVLAKLRDTGALATDYTPLEPPPDVPNRFVYISFVGTFAEADPTWVPYTEAERDAAYEAIDWDAVQDYHALTVTFERSLWLGKVSAWTVRESAVKDTLGVTVYDDPLGVPDWGVVVADCPDGGWFSAHRVKLTSFQGGAAVPLGSEVRILEGKE